MKVMILAAGLGTRLRPLTFERAKPAVPVLGIPLLVRLVEWLRSQGAAEFRINLHHLPASVERLFPDRDGSGRNISFSYEPEILGTAGGLKANERFFDRGTFLMVNGDIVPRFGIAESLAFHRERRALATLLLYEQRPPYRHVPVRIDEAGRLHRFKGVETGGSPRPEAYVFTGVHILEPEIFRYIPSGRFYEVNDQAYPQALAEGRDVCGFPVAGYWNDLGNPRRYLEATRDLLLMQGIDPPVWIDPAAVRAPSARVGPYVSIGPGCILGEGTSVENSILWEGVRVTQGSTIADCIVARGVTVVGDKTNRVITVTAEEPLDKDQ